MFEYVYLCVQKDKYDSFKCAYFGSVLEADAFFTRNYQRNAINRSIIVPIPSNVLNKDHNDYCKQYIADLTIRIE